MSDAKEFEVDSASATSTLGQVPFPLKTSHGRRYFRIELSSPTLFRVLTCKKGKIKLSKERASGQIISLSEGGVLLLTNSTVPEEGFIVLTLNLNKLVILEGVLGKIKRVEASGEGDFLVGVEFASREQLERLVPLQEIARLPVKVASFNRKLREIISSCMRTAQLAT